MNQSTIIVEYDRSLARITLNRPEKLNAINLAWVQELSAAVSDVATRPDVRVVLVRGAGHSFCSGLDLDMMAREGMSLHFYELQERAFRGIELMDKITIAVLHGYCLGGGVQLAISCDIRVCSTDCLIGLPAINEGLFPGMAPFRLPRLIGRGAANRLILSGEQISSDEALRLWLVDYLVSPQNLEAELSRIVEPYLAAPPTASAASKRLIRQAFDAPFETVYEESKLLLADCLASPEVEAGRETWQRRQAKRRQT